MYSGEQIEKKLQQLLAFENNGRHEYMFSYGINIWPLIRSELQFNVLRNTEEYNAIADQPFKKEGRVSVLRMRLKLALDLLRIKKHIEQLNLPTPKVLLFSPGNAYYTDQIDGKLYNRHLDPFLEELKLAGIATEKFHVITEAELNKKYAASSVFFLAKEIQDYIWNYSNHLFQKYHSEESNDLLKDLELNQNSVNKRIRFILALKRVLKMVLKRIRPETIAMVCFYDDYCFALNLAAKELGIKTIDIQHGKQGEKHFCYSHYISMKGSVSAMMPDFFWNWGADSVNTIKKHLNNKDEIKCIAGGNLWLAKWKQNDFFKPDKQGEVFIESLKKYKKRFLYSAQPIGDFVMPPFLKAFVAKHPEFFFCIRIHPREKKNIGKYLEEFAGHSNVEVLMSSELPLYYLLNHIDISITRWSSVALEALNFGCNSWLVDAFGVSSFKHQVDKGFIKAVLSENDFETEVNHEGRKAEEDLIITDRSEIKKKIIEYFN